MKTTPRHFLDIHEIAPKTLRAILDYAAQTKKNRLSVRKAKPLELKTLALIFERPSTRTRVSFDVGMRELGGETIMLTGAEMQLGRGETLADTARVLSRFVDAMMIRILDHSALEELAQFATIPVINGLTKKSHPCQIMADLLTFEEHLGAIDGKTVAWIGDGNNVCSSWIEAAAAFPFTLKIATPKELAPDRDVLKYAQEKGAKIELFDVATDAAKDAHCIITDCWVSMGDKDAEKRHKLLEAYQVNDALMAKAKSDAIFMHCLPAHREEEVTTSVIDGPASVVFDEAENRLHAQKAILAWCMELI